MDLKCIQIAGDAPGPHLLLTGGVHGDEFVPMRSLRELARQISPPTLRGRLTIVPVVNEAAFERGQRTAEDGLDLARTCPGDQAGSVTQRTAYALSELIREADALVDLHTGGTTMTILPLAGYMLHPDAGILSRQREMARAFNLPVVWGTDYRLEGRSLSVARDAGVPAIYVEYLGGGSSDRRGVAACIAGCKNVMSALNMCDQTSTGSAVEYFVEDAREHSGHLQLCNPSPSSGCFEASVELGQRVRIGERLGFVSGVLGDEAAEIKTTQDGIVIALRSFCRVEEGDPLVVVMELMEEGPT